MLKVWHMRFSVGPIAASWRRGFAGLRPFLLAVALGGLATTAAYADQSLFEAAPVFDYARNGDSGAVSYLLKKGTPVDLVSPDGYTVLTIGAAKGDLEIVDMALENGARVNREDSFGKTALGWAADHGHVAVADRLLQAGADIDHQTHDGLTPLMLAVRSNRLAMVQFLLRKKPDLTLLDYTGRSALGWARIGRDRRAEAMLRRAGARDEGRPPPFERANRPEDR